MQLIVIISLVLCGLFTRISSFKLQNTRIFSSKLYSNKIIIDGEEYIEVVDDINEASNDFDKFINSLPLSKIALHNKLSSNKSRKWPGTRPPLTNMARLDKKMDATWGRGKYRTEVWNDDVNPMNDWWEAYSQSEEEIEALAAGYDFNNPEEYFKSKGIDYKQAREEYEKATTIAWEAYKKERATPFDANALATAKKNYNEMMEKKKGGENVDIDKLVELEINYFKLLQKEKEHNFRIDDNKRQQAKGQPSLDSEDTGERYKNDPVEKK